MKDAPDSKEAPMPLGPVVKNRFAPPPPAPKKDVLIRPGVIQKPDGHLETIPGHKF